MSTIKIMPCLDMKEGRVVKGIHFVDIKDAGNPEENAAFYEKEGACIREVKDYLKKRGLQVNL